MDDMNFTNLLSNNRLADFTKWLPAIAWTCWILVAFLAAKIVWTWVIYFTSPSEVQPFRVSPVKTASRNASLDISGLVGRNLFGAVNQAVTAPVEDVKLVVTKLNLTLRGIYAAETADKANAIIEDGRGKQAVYFVDEKLEVSGRVFLRQVQRDRVVLETNGVREQLLLITQEMPIRRVKSKTSLRKSSGKKVEDKRKNRRISKKLNEYRDKFKADPRSVADVISGTPHVVNGELMGFKIRPGKDKRLFQELGLRRGDVVTGINGVSLTNMQDAMTLMNDAQSLQEVNVEIQRGNDQLSLLLNLNEKAGRE